MVDIVAKWFDAVELKVSNRNVLLYRALIDEEHRELLEAKTDEDEVDALVDLMWVTAGCLINKLGVEGALKAINEVRRSNFTKVAQTEGAAQASVAQYKENGVNAAYRKNGDHGFIIVRTEDNKVLKPITFLEPDWSWIHEHI